MRSGQQGHPSGRPSPDEQRRLLKEARLAGQAGNEVAMLKALTASGLLTGLKHRLMARARSRGDRHLHPDDADFAITQACATLYEKLSAGQDVVEVAGFLLKVADNRAVDRFRERCRLADPAVVAQHEVDQEQTVLDKLIADEDRDDEVDSVAKRHHAYQLLLELLPRLGQSRVQDVMKFIIQAARDGVEHVGDSEIAQALGLTVETAKKSRQRGFERLRRLVSERRYGELIIEYLREYPDR